MIVEAAKQHYNTVKVLFEAGKIKTYKQLIAHLPYSTLAKDLNVHAPRMKRLYKDVSQMKLIEMYRLSNLLNIKLKKLEPIIFKEVERCISKGK